MQAVVLAGGFGTRLRSAVADIPKPMAPVGGVPFLQYVLRDLVSKGVTRTVLAVGWKKDQIIVHFGREFAGMEVEYSVEDEPLFTGGAIKQALAFCTDSDVLVVNGDTLFDVDMRGMMAEHVANAADVTVAVREVSDSDRYGVVETEGSRIIGFSDKKPGTRGLVNGGVYVVKRSLVTPLPERFSFEEDVLQTMVGQGRFCAFHSEGYFIDIGVPDDYARAQTDFASGRHP